MRKFIALLIVLAISVSYAGASLVAGAGVILVTTTADSGPGSLRDAISTANANPGSDVIEFDIAPGGLQTIMPLSALPDITDPVTIDATTQSGYVAGTVGTPATLVVELDGTLAGAGAPGLLISGTTDSTIKGFVINNFGGHGIELLLGGSHTIVTNFIGIEPDGITNGGNGNTRGLPRLEDGGSGIRISGSSNNRVGLSAAAPDPADRNVVSGNFRGEMWLENEGEARPSNNEVAGNYIGLDSTGLLPVDNPTHAFFGPRAIFNAGGAGNVFGGYDPVLGNVIGGHQITFGLELVGDTRENVFANNLIGTDKNGNGDLGVQRGISLLTNFPPGTPGPSFNVFRDNLIANSIRLSVAFSDANDNVFEDNIVINAIVPVGGTISIVQASDRNIIRNNLIGVDQFGTPSGNAGTAIYVGGVQYDHPLLNFVNGPADRGPKDTVIEGNIIAYNEGTGILVTSDMDACFVRDSGGALVVPSAAVPVGSDFDCDPALAVDNGRDGDTTNTIITGNSIFANEGLGIDLTKNMGLRGALFGIPFVHGAPDGVTPNDDKDEDDGANRLQNFPEVDDARLDDGELRIQGHLRSERDRSYRLEFFLTPSSALDPSGIEEGQIFLGSVLIETSGGGNESFDVELDLTGGPAVADGDVLTSTATEIAGPGSGELSGTSEFSAGVVIEDD